MELRNGTSLKGGEYVIKKKLGQGGMGITYLATMRVEVKRGLGTVTTQADVVVKEFFIGTCCDRDSNGRTMTVVSRKFDDTVERGLKKFRKEATNLSQMRHDNIVHVIDLFSENDTEYIVMDFLPGGSLEGYVLKNGPLPASKATRRISEVASALQYMHNHKLCHFDVKPGNVMLGAEGQAVLIDFGIAKHYGKDNRHTSDVLFMGTSEGYAPLEQATDSVESFSPQTDVYALAATLYFLLTGKSPGKASFNINKVLPADRPSTIPENLWLLIHRCMKPNPNDRPTDASEFLRLLPQISASEEISEEPLPELELATEFQLPSTEVIEDDNATVVKQEHGTENNANATQNPKPQPKNVSPETPRIKTFTVNGVSFNMVYVEGGTFMMGETPEEEWGFWGRCQPVHEVTLSSYMIGETQVTKELWSSVMNSNSFRIKGEKLRSFVKFSKENNRNSLRNEGEKLPMDNISWEDCQKFIRKLNKITGLSFRLPTEAEWEFAARGGNKSHHTIYAGSDDLESVAWWTADFEERFIGFINQITIHEVGMKLPNELGIYDMSGNVREWCNDWYGEYSSVPQTNPEGPSSGTTRVNRGGCCTDDDECRITYRCDSDPFGKYCGFRLAL